MAAWHFELSIIPESGLRRIHGEIPETLVEYCKVSLDTDFGELPSHNYWEGINIFRDVLPVAKIILAEEIDRTKTQVRLGTKDGDRFTLWEDEVLFEFDLRNPDLEILESVLRMARRFNCKLAVGEDGRVVGPEMLEVLLFVKISGAFKFVTNPQNWLSQIASRYPESQ